MSSYTLPIKKGADWSYTIAVPNTAGWTTLKLQIEQNGSFDTPDIEKTVTVSNGNIVISGIAADFGKYRDARFRVIGQRAGWNDRVLQSGNFTAVDTEEASVLNDVGIILEDKLPVRLSEAALNESFDTRVKPVAARNPLTGWFHADGYGAKFDGVTNDTAAIQAAVNAAKAVKGVVWLPSGVAVTGFIDCTGATGLTIRGNGIGSTELRPRPGATLQRIFGSTGSTSGIHFAGITFRAAAVDTGSYPRRGRTFSGTQLNSAITFDGDLLPSGSVGVVRDIEVNDCEFIGTTGLPVLLRGVRGSAVIDSCRFYNTLDVGWTYCERAVCTDNISIKSADNGFSLSRGNQSVTCVGNTVDLCSYWGIWVAGFEQGQGAIDAGPTNFTVTGNVVTKAGFGGIALTDAPKHGTVTGNIVNGAYRGPTDQQSDIRGLGISVSGYPTSDPNNVQVYAENISISGNTLIDCARGGIMVTGASDILVTGNLVINPGTPFLADGTTAVSSSDLSQNFGISILNGPNTSVTRLVIRANEMVDKRATPVANWPLYVSGAPFTRLQANSHFGFRQAAVINDDTTTENISGGKVFSALAAFSGGARAGANATTGTVPGFDINGAATSHRPFRWLTAGADRWWLTANGTAEGGSNAGSDLELRARNDTGAALWTVWQVIRSLGVHAWQRAHAEARVAQTLNVNGAVTIDASAGNIQAITLAANATSSTITNPTTGQRMTIGWAQDATGGHTYVWPTNCKFAGGAAPTASTTGAWRDRVMFEYDGINWIEISRAIGVR